MKPKHPYPSTILQTPAGERPPDGSPELDEFLLMQEKARSAWGSSIWAMRAHAKLMFPTNFYCAFMSNPSMEAYKGWKQCIMHELAHPEPTVFGGYGHNLLTVGNEIIRPFTAGQHELGLHAFFDANLGAPRQSDVLLQGPVSDGTRPTDPPAFSRSMTGGVIMLGGGPLSNMCLRQHLVSPDSHTSEITAGGTVLHRLITYRGVLQELGIPQLHPSPLYTDSQSSIFAGNSAASARQSVWLNRRTAVIREAVDMEEIRLEKIGDPDNVANYFTKPVTTAVMKHYFSYTHGSPEQRKSVLTAAEATASDAAEATANDAHPQSGKPSVNVLAHNILPPLLAFLGSTPDICPALSGTPVEFGYTFTPLSSDSAPAPAPAPAPAAEPAPAQAPAPAPTHMNGVLKCMCDLCGHNSRDGCLNRGWPQYNYRCAHCHNGCMCFCDDPRMSDHDTEDYTSE